MRQVIFFWTRTVARMALAGAALAACNSPDAAPAAPPEGHLDYCGLPVSCREIVAVCHIKDDGTNAEISECHETAHDKGTDSACRDVHDSCIAKCNAAPALEG